MLNESDSLPAIALGLRDIAGTGLFSSEYFVLTKKFGNFDITTGLGWGLLGSANNIYNPLKGLDKSFGIRNAELGQGGDFALKSWFSGATSLLGGIEYDLKRYGMRLKLEYDTSKPHLNRNPRADSKPSSNFNFGINYFPYNWLTLFAGLERGSEFRFSFSIKGNFYEDTLPKPKPKNVVKLDQNLQKRAFENKEIFYRSLNRSLRDESIYLQAASYDEEKLEMSVASSKYFSTTRPVGRSKNSFCPPVRLSRRNNSKANEW